MEINPQDLQSKDLYKLLTGSVIPRPIAWVSTISADGQPNLAPFSFFTVISSKPPTILFCPGIRGTDGGQKDTYHNIQATGEFVVNFVPYRLVEAMNITATELPANVNEFERAELTPEASRVVKPPRVAESPIHFECKLNQVITIHENPGGGHVVIGEVVHMHFDPSVYREGHYIDMEAFDAVGRLAGGGYVRTRDQFTVNRLPSEIKTD